MLESKETMTGFNKGLQKAVLGDPNAVYCSCGHELLEIPVYCVELKKGQLVRFCPKEQIVKYEQDTLTKSWEPYSPKFIRDGRFGIQKAK